MKDYMTRLKSGCKKPVFILWWVFRAIMIVTLVAGFFNENILLTGQIHIAVCIVASFFWEFTQASCKKSLFRYIPSSIHTVINVGLLFSAVFGIHFGLYYSTRFFDPLMLAFFAFVSVLYGYEIAYAMVKRDKFSATKAMV